MFDDVVLLNVALNIVLCIVIIVWDLYFYFKVNETEKWAKALYIFVAVCWLVRYVLFLLDFNSLGRKSVNPALIMLVTLTLLSLAIGSVIRVQRINGFNGLTQDIKDVTKRLFIWKSKK